MKIDMKMSAQGYRTTAAQAIKAIAIVTLFLWLSLSLTSSCFAVANSQASSKISPPSPIVAMISSNHTSSNSNTKTTSSTQTTSATAKTEPLNSSKGGTSGRASDPQEPQLSIQLADPQQEQSTDISAAYVPIPIAQAGSEGSPFASSLADQQVEQSSSQQNGEGGSTSSQSGSTTWSGLWPKKFQIGYIKQSDLHQVLIESLKGDPFVSIATPKGSPSSSSTTSQTSSTKSIVQQQTTSAPTKQLAQPPQQHVEIPKIPVGQWGPNAKNPPQITYGSNGINNFRDFRDKVQFPVRFAGPEMSFFAKPQSRPFNGNLQQQHHQKGNPYSMNNNIFNNHRNHNYQQQQQHQFMLANRPYFSKPNNLPNQPMYSITGNFQQQGNNNNELPRQPKMYTYNGPQSSYNGNIARPQKSLEYLSQWRPVNSNDDRSNNQQQQQIQSLSMTKQPDYMGIQDSSFEDGFNMPSKDAQVDGPSMSRHPMLDGYMNSQASPSAATTTQPPIEQQQSSKGSGKLPSPAMVINGKTSAKRPESDIGSIKGPVAQTKDSSATKSSQGQIKGDGLNLSVNRRRASNGTSTSTPVSVGTMSPLDMTTEMFTTTTAASAVTTISSTSEDANGNSTSTNTSVPSMVGDDSTTTQSSVSTPTQASGEETAVTTEPDSETVDVDSNTEGSMGDDSTNASTTTTSTTTKSPSSVSAGSASKANPNGSAVASSANERGNEQDLSEVVTQASVSQQASGTVSLPGIQGDDSPASSTMSPSSVSQTTMRSTSTSREETTPTNSNSDASSTSTSTPTQSTTSATGAKGGEVEGSKGSRFDSSMSDNALLAQSGAAEIAKTTSNRQRASSTTPSSSSSVASNSKKTRSSERLLEADQKKQPQQTNNKLITKKLTPVKDGKRSGKQVNQFQSVKGGSVKATLSKSANQQQATKSAKQNSNQRTLSNSRSKPVASQKTTRMVAASERLQQAPQQAQVVSMTAAQAQSTAQTLASLLLSRCLSSNSCSHLLDICTTKQAMIPIERIQNNNNNNSNLESSSSPTSPVSGNQSLAWSFPVGLMSSSVMSLTHALQADKVLKVFPQWKDAIENLVDQDPQTGYTIILPSNDAIDRLPLATVDSWLSNSDLMSQIIENHNLDSAELLEVGFNQNNQNQNQNNNNIKRDSITPKTRVIKSRGLQVNQHRGKMVTINGKRVIYANQPAPSNGMIHVIDGVLDWPTAPNGRMLDIMETLKQCDKFDGFVTLAEGTGLMQILKQDGPMTVFVPSNEALRKIPDEELDLIKNNSTALKEFLMYHVVNGSYFSQDLRDGQQLASILDMKPIQVGVRVDGCSRRLVEANTSPMRRPDIVAKNGVIHILDWYLTVRDNEWCDSMSGSSTSSASASSSSQSNTIVMPNNSNNSERLRQLSSEQNFSYATRVPVPYNHKLNHGANSFEPINRLDPTSASSSAGDLVVSKASGILYHQKGSQQQQQQQQQLSSAITTMDSSSPSQSNPGDFGAKSIIITATPIHEQNSTKK